MTKHRLLGVGIYTVPEAMRLTKVNAPRIRRWLHGYSFLSNGKLYESSAVFRSGIEPIGKTQALTFLDLLEIRFVEGFLRLGVSWPKLRRLHAEATKLVGSDHPFCTQKFKTDGRTIVAEISGKAQESILIDLANKQQFFARVIAPYLKDVVFRGKHAAEWWPLGEHRSVVLDPERRFGLPIIARRGLPTAMVVRTYLAEKSIEAACRWMDLTEDEVADAVEYENSLVAA